MNERRRPIRFRPTPEDAIVLQRLRTYWQAIEGKPLSWGDVLLLCIREAANEPPRPRPFTLRNPEAPVTEEEIQSMLHLLITVARNRREQGE